ncbi:LytR/AlgR family response regulator transcription factor [Pedobacter flavus]|uniref:LytTR family transcriptional regulator DNA-binding domain-containing protein n=1 Tax=Pedobacter flavus TaxID=3113906 RepID=A0ABU7GYQ2_9SPHI|nr:LytTR family transcriptional regulator DNA-binding domain-containing protein [Pedobacter sp. VNH31]MEE1884148.1 LytTR family transcriptional regulator DNA-binding domain-containing protein [Pedobacter sp. VNH31]
MKVIIIGEDASILNLLADYLTNITDFEIVDVFNSTNYALMVEKLHKNEIDLIFFEINRETSDLIEVCRYLRKCTKSLILTSKNKDFTSFAFDVGADNYLHIPITEEKFNIEIFKIKNKIREKQILETHKFGNFYLKGGSKNSFSSISIKEILSVEGLRNYVIFNYFDSSKPESKNSITYLSLKEVEKNLESLYFLRINKSQIISLRHILKVSGNKITMKNDREFIVGAKYRDKFFTHINKHKIF